MATNLHTIINRLPKKEKQLIEVRAKELIEEEMNLQGLRKAQQLTQSELAVKLGVKQAEVSRLEQRTDMYISTLYSCVKAMGGSLEIIAKFPEKVIKVSQLGSKAPIKAMSKYRSSKSGQFVTESYAKHHMATTESQSGRKTNSRSTSSGSRSSSNKMTKEDRR